MLQVWFLLSGMVLKRVLQHCARWIAFSNSRRNRLWRGQKTMPFLVISTAHLSPESLRSEKSRGDLFCLFCLSTWAAIFLLPAPQSFSLEVARRESICWPWDIWDLMRFTIYTATLTLIASCSHIDQSAAEVTSMWELLCHWSPAGCLSRGWMRLLCQHFNVPSQAEFRYSFSLIPQTETRDMRKPPCFPRCFKPLLSQFLVSCM